jgi:hypothetical protein
MESQAEAFSLPLDILSIVIKFFAEEPRILLLYEAIYLSDPFHYSHSACSPALLPSLQTADVLQGRK